MARIIGPHAGLSCGTLNNVFSRSWWVLVLSIMVGIAAVLWWRSEPSPRELPADWPAIVGVAAADMRAAEPFGIAAAANGTLYVTDGVGGNRLTSIAPDGKVALIAGGDAGFRDSIGAEARFHTPSGLALDPHGVLYVADTGNDAIRRVTADGRVTTLATGLSGPVGIAIDGAGRIFVSDTYNDRIVTLDADGVASPLALDVSLDTPTGIAVDSTGTLYVADTGNNVVRAIDRSGLSATIDAYEIGGFQRPIGVAADTAGTLYVTDEAARVIAVPRLGYGARVIAGSSPGFQNGRGLDAQFRRPTGIAALEPGRLVVADSGNALLRSITATTLAEAVAPPSPRIAPRFDVAAFTERSLLWPLEPLTGPFEIAGTMGEARGEDAARFHAGIDVRAEQGTPVLAVRDGIVAAPLSTGDLGSLNEWLRIGELTYVHLRAGRTRRGELVDDRRFVAKRDELGAITRMRVKRGAHFRTGDVVGTVNPFNHVHLNVGWGGEEYNPLLFGLVQFEDTVPPTIARGGIQLLDAQGTPFVKRVKGRVLISGAVQVIVDAWDQADANRPNRRLGVYALGYQVLNADGTPAPGYAEPIETITFDRLSTNPDATRLVYAMGSGIPFYGQRRTRFLYIVTNRFRDGVATPGVWDTTTLPPGDYTLRIRVSDIYGNEARHNRDVPVTVAGREHSAGG